MILAVIESLKFVVKPQKHTVAQADEAARFTFKDWSKKSGAYKGVIAKDEKEAVSKLREQIKTVLRTSMTGLNPCDFVFEIRYTPADPDGFLWVDPCISPMKDFPVGEGKVIN